MAEDSKHPRIKRAAKGPGGSSAPKVNGLPDLRRVLGVNHGDLIKCGKQQRDAIPAHTILGSPHALTSSNVVVAVELTSRDPLEPEPRGGLSRAIFQVLYIKTSQQKVRSSVLLGPPNWTKSRTFMIRFTLAL